MIYQGSARHPVHEAIIHTSATPERWFNGKTNENIFNEIKRWHVEDNGWRDIGYHRVIMRDGEIWTGRSLYEVGAHVAGHNSGTVGICLIGAGTPVGKASDHYTTKQRTALKQYLRELANLTDLQKVTGHNDYAAKDCPGFKVNKTDWL